MAEHNELGKIGEEIAKTFLMKQGFSFVEANYSCHFGEIDLIFRKGEIIHFIEVKSIKVGSLHVKSKEGIDPRDNLTKSKWGKLLRTIEVYSHHKGIKEGNWRLDLACIYIDMTTRQAKVEMLENVLVE